MATWADPTASTTYANWPTRLTEHFDSQAKMFDDGVSWTGLPTNTVRWSSANSRFEKWNGSSWVNLSTALTDVCKTANNLSDLANAGTARTNLGLGSIAVLASPLPVLNGGTGSTSASAARTALGLGTIATQAANSVSITGGSVTGITDLAVTDGGTGASDAATARTNLGVGTGNSPTFTGLNLSGLTASRYVKTDGSKNLTSAAQIPTTDISSARTTWSPTPTGSGSISLTSIANWEAHFEKIGGYYFFQYTTTFTISGTGTTIYIPMPGAASNGDAASFFPCAVENSANSSLFGGWRVVGGVIEVAISTGSVNFGTGFCRISIDGKFKAA